MEEREFWIQVRRGLMTMLDAIERKYDLPRSANRYQPRREAPNGTTRECASSLSTSDKESA